MRQLLLCLLLLAGMSPSDVAAEKKKVESKKRYPLGWEEKVLVGKEGLTLHAKLDTGHLGSAIFAQNIERFKKKKEGWVRFIIEDRYGKKATFEKRILRRATLRGSGKNRRSEYVVELGLCLGGRYFEDEIRLSNREGFLHELRLGRQSLEGHFFVDPAMSYTTQPKCSGSKVGIAKKKSS